MPGIDLCRNHNNTYCELLSEVDYILYLWHSMWLGLFRLKPNVVYHFGLMRGHLIIMSVQRTSLVPLERTLIVHGLRWANVQFVCD